MIIKRKKETEVRKVKPNHAAPSLQPRKNPGLQSWCLFWNPRKRTFKILEVIFDHTARHSQVKEEPQIVRVMLFFEIRKERASQALYMTPEITAPSLQTRKNPGLQ